MMFKPLKDIKVLDCSLAGSGPSCTKILREYGAEVIWIECLKGCSTRFVHKYDFYTAGKRSIAIDLKTLEGKDIFSRLFDQTDIFVTNYRKKSRERLGLNYEALHVRKPCLIYAEITGYGDVGNEAHEPGYDPVAFWAKSGMLMDIAEKGSMVVPPVAVGDIAAGLALAGGVVAALYNRDKTGEGCHVFTSLYGVGAYLNHDAAIEVQYGEKYPKTRKAPRRALLNTYRCKNEKWITITIVEDIEKNFWPLLKAIGREDLVGDPRWSCIEDTMYEGAPEVVAILDEAFGHMTQDEAVAALRVLDIPVSRVQSTEEMLNDPQALENRFFYRRKVTNTCMTGEDEILAPASPVKFNSLNSGTEECGYGPKPGEHSVEILQEYGYSETEIQDFLNRKIISQSDTPRVQNKA